MNRRSPHLLLILLKGIRLALHLLYAVLLAVYYPRLRHVKQRRTLKTWSRQLLDILGIGIRTEGVWPMHSEGGYLIVANHVSWLDIFVLNAICPSRFIAKAEIRHWPLIGWLCKRSNTLFIERTVRQDAALVNRHASALLKQGVCIGLFPEGTTTDGHHVGHFHSALIQPAIDAGVMLCPIALRYQNETGEHSDAAAFTGDMTLPQSLWHILRSPRLDVLLAFTPALATAGVNRRVLARTAQEAISRELQNAAGIQQVSEQNVIPCLPKTRLATQSAYAPLLLPLPEQTRQ